MVEQRKTRTAVKAAPAPAPQPAPQPAAVDTKAELAVAQAQLAAMQAELSALKAQALIGSVGAVSPVGGVSHYVGIRNVSNYTVALPESPVPNEPPVVLSADSGTPNPQQRAVISYSWWLQIRNSKQVANGMIRRDDTVLGPNHTAGPADGPQDLPAEHSQNVVEDPAVWLVSRDEVQLRRDIESLTSEPTIKRLQYTIDREVARIQAALPADEKDPKQRAELAVAALPGKLKLAEELLHNRWVTLTDRFRVTA